MMNVFATTKPFGTLMMKLLAGLVPKKVEIEPGTIMNFWAPMELVDENSKKKITKPVVLLLHGFCADGLLTWFFQAPALATDYTVFFADLLFFGDSISDNPDRSTSFQAECLAKGLRMFGVEKCTVVGFSYGGMVGFKMAKLFPNLVDSMVVTGTVMESDEPAAGGDSWKNERLARWSHFLLPETTSGGRKLLKFGSHRFQWFPDFVVSDFLEVMYEHKKEKRQLLEALYFSDDDDFKPANLTQRVHLLWGANDRILSLEVAHSLKT
ncbi:OLC1v1003223C2 [Oldenlandia corymbosa var. corymbosa]|nr:OLC1v1003223C2 [Oldenlandia corymbosa var. corymbosa]